MSLLSGWKSKPRSPGTFPHELSQASFSHLASRIWAWTQAEVLFLRFSPSPAAHREAIRSGFNAVPDLPCSSLLLSAANVLNLWILYISIPVTDKEHWAGPAPKGSIG